MKKFLLFLVLTLAVGLLGSLHSNWTKGQSEHELLHIQEDILRLDRRIQDQLGSIKDDQVELQSLRKLWPQEGIAFVIYNENRAVEWTSNAVPFAIEYSDRLMPKEGIIRLKNAWFLCRTIANEDQLLVSYALLRTNFGFENRYVSNKWGPGFRCDSRFDLTLSTTDSEPLVLSDGPTEMRLRESAPESGQLPSWNSLIWLVFFLLLLSSIWHAANWISSISSPTVALVSLTVMMLLLRVLMQWWQLPSALYSLEIFGPTPHATSSFIPSLGDLVLNLLVLVIVLLRFGDGIRFKNPKSITRSLSIAVGILMLWPIHYLFKILVFNSSFSLDLNSPFTLDWYSIVGLMASFIMLLLLQLIIRIIAKNFLADKLKPKESVLPFVLGTALLGLFLGAEKNDWVLAVSGSAIVIFMLFLQSWLSERGRLQLRTSNILAFALLACVMLSGLGQENERESRKSLARKIDKQEDPISEYLFDGLAQDLLADRNLRIALSTSPLDAEKVLAELHEALSYDHWNRYVALVDVFNHEGGLMASDRERTGPNYFELQTEFGNGLPTMSQPLRYVGHISEDGGYLARLEVEGKRTQKNLIIFLRLVPEKSDNILGFTDLFVDEHISTSAQMEGYSFALYDSGELKEQSGPFAYSLSDSHFGKEQTETSFVSRDGFSHLVYRPQEGRLVVVSRASDGFMGYLTNFSYLFLFYLLCVGIITLFSGSLLADLRNQKSFRNRINLAMSSVLFVSLLLIGVLTVYYVVKEYNDRNREMISERSRSVLIEMEHKLRDREQFDEEDRAMLSALLVKFSKVFFTDINLYYLDGRLLATSRPRVFNEGLMAEMIDPKAYNEMRFGQRSSFIQEETIGNLEYLSAYVPFRNEKREVIAFMSLPYFARQYGLQQEIFSLLAALTNIYVFLILLSVVLALVISNRITEPLRFIRESLKDLKLDRANRAIEWQSNDEIGELVNEYNRTLNELVESAELLAKSERENAWREMAKQVAHEIKNPLTPMKLSIQMLQRSKNDGAKDLNERIDKVANTLIEQIDTLSNIATEFSSFALMPRSVVENVNLHDILSNVAALHQNSNIEIELHFENASKATVLADKEQMLRAFTNLVRNAIQAIPEERNGRITIGLILNDGNWVASVKDNGSGIPAELQDKVFAPNFTTKSSGMGLGLAMVKSTVESVNGKIWFDTSENDGTTFYVSLPTSDQAAAS